MNAGEPFLAMQFLPGGSLASRIALHAEHGRERLPMTQLRHWLPRIAAALDHAHANGVIHRDVKPANIFFDSQGLACLGDFGIAKIIEDSATDAGDPTLTGTHMTLGTGAYMAPERLTLRTAIDGRADQYSLAICVFEALAGMKPFRSTTEYIFVEQATMPPPDLAKLRPDIPASCCKAVDKALAKQPSDRFATCAEFAAAVLKEAPVAEVETAFAWLECPACRRLVRLPQAAAGREGRCPRCRAALVIARSLEGLWLQAEYGPAASKSMPAGSPKPLCQPRLWRPFTLRSLAALAAVAITAMVVPWFWREPTITPPPREPLQPPAAVIALDKTAEPSNTDFSVPRRRSLAEPNSAPPTCLPGASLASSLADLPPLARTTALDAESDPTLMPKADHPAEAPPETPPVQPESDAAWVERRETAKNHFDEIVRWVKVGDPRNSMHLKTERGAVEQEFYLAQYELTNADYCMFLNASRAGIVNEAGIGDRAINPAIGIRRHTIGPGQGFLYEPEPSMADKPAVVMATDAIALVNWLHNIHRNGTDDITSGAYAVANAPPDPPRVNRNPEALVFIPTIDEWAKAAYFRSGTPSAAYYQYPTATNLKLVPVSGSMPGGRPALRGVETAANFDGKAAWVGSPQGGGLTDVGTNGAPSGYGAFDMGGNAAEWVIVDQKPVACGGDCRSPLALLKVEALAHPEPMASTAAPAVTGLRMARSTAGIAAPLVADDYERLLKGPTFGRLDDLANLKTNPKLNIKQLRLLSPEDVDAILKRLGAFNAGKNAVENDGIDSDVEAVVRALAARLKAVKAILKSRDEKIRALLPATRIQKPVGNLIDAVQQFVVGVQAQADIRAVIEEHEDQLAPVQALVLAALDGLPTLRKNMELRYGKP